MKQLAVLGGALVILFGLMYAGTKFAPLRAPVSATQGTVACLPFGHQNLVIHIHPTIQIFVDEKPQVVPANIGVTPGCMKEVHTHDASGTIHVEAVSPARAFEIKQFFEVWNQPFERDGFLRSVSVNGAVLSAEELSQYKMKDKDRIKVEYTTVKVAQ